MDFKLALARAWAIVTLDKAAVREVGEDENALLPALLITAIGGLLGTLITMHPTLWVAGLVLSIVGLVIGAAILHLLAILFGGQGAWADLFKVLGHGAGLVSWARIVPIVGWIAGFWSIPVAVIAVEELYGLTRGKAIAVVLIPVAVGLALTCVAAITLGVGIAALLAHANG